MTFTFNTSPDCHSRWQCRHLDFISQFTTDLRHIHGVADTLSCIKANALTHNYTPVIDFHLMAKAQLTDPELQHLLAHKHHFSKLNPTLSTLVVPLFCDTSTSTPPWPLVPEQLRKVVFTAFHSLSHPGTWNPISAQFIWPIMNKDINQCTKSCLQCQQIKVTRRTNAHSNHQIPVLMWCTLIWLAHFLFHKATNTCSSVWIDSHAGLRHSLPKTSLPKLSHKH